MATVYFMSLDGKKIVALDCEERITYSRANESTKSSIFSGSQVSDGYIEGNYVVNLSGRITYSKTNRQNDNPDPLEFQQMVDDRVSSLRRFTLYTSKQGFQLLNNLENCVITDHSVTVDEFEDTIKVDMTIEAQFVSNSAKRTYLKPVRKKKVEAAYDTEKNSGTGTKEVKTEEQSSTLWKKTFDYGVDISQEIVDALKTDTGGTP